ncbi:MAG: hypothetical protein K6E34_13295 [Lachnospiraceae bacterium]|nr:hypothetical protein [Lachnospiraceae bacterium]
MYIKEENRDEVVFVNAGQGLSMTNVTKSAVDVYYNGQFLKTLKAPMGNMYNGWKFTVSQDAYLALSYKKNSHKFYITDVTAATLAAIGTSPAATSPAADTASVQNAPATKNQAAGTPDLSNPEIKAIWDQAVAVKAAYDAETNSVKKKELQKQFTALMSQIGMN